MKINLRILIGTEGEMAVAVPKQRGVTFDLAKEGIANLERVLGTDLDFKFDGDVEKHTHGADGQTIIGDVSHLTGH